MRISLPPCGVSRVSSVRRKSRRSRSARASSSQERGSAISGRRSLNGPQHRARGMRLIEHVEVNSRHAGVDELLDLSGCVSDSLLKLPLGVIALRKRVHKGLRQASLAERGNPLDLREVGHRQNAGDDGNFDAESLAGLAKAEEVGIVVKELRNYDVSANSDLSL